MGLLARQARSRAAPGWAPIRQGRAGKLRAGGSPRQLFRPKARLRTNRADAENGGQLTDGAPAPAAGSPSRMR
jgi:hypothetical protein